jgi:tetratricopeptide (TPR) repeat protein
VAFGQQTQGVNNSAPPDETSRVRWNANHYPPGHKVTAADVAQAEADFKNAQAGISRLNKASADALAAGNYAVAETNARLSKSIGPSAPADELLAQALVAQGKDKEALDQYQNMIPNRPVNSGDLAAYGLLLLKAGRYAEAVAAYNKAMPPLSQDELAGVTRGSMGDDYPLRAGYHFDPDTPQPVELETALHIAYGMRGSWPGRMQSDKSMDQFKLALQLSPDSEVAKYYYDNGLQHQSTQSHLQRSNEQRMAAMQAADTLRTEARTIVNRTLVKP